jgi:hypothetical protein
VLFKAGDQVPVIRLDEVVGSADNVAPEHMAGTAVKFGVKIGFTVITKEAVLAH